MSADTNDLHLVICHALYSIEAFNIAASRRLSVYLIDGYTYRRQFVIWRYMVSFQIFGMNLWFHLKSQVYVHMCLWDVRYVVEGILVDVKCGE